MLPENGNQKIEIKSSGNKYPSIERIEIGKDYSSFDELLEKIGEASSLHYKKWLPGGRLASPIYVTVVKINNRFHPLITTLYNNRLYKNIKTQELNDNIANFKNSILNKR